MSCIDGINRALEYIEQNLDKEIDVEELSKIAGCSKFYFQRLFTSLSDVTLTEYIRKRRMTRAASDIKNTEKKLIEIANDYNYNSPAAFNRAFKEVHGISPSMVRSSEASLIYFPPMKFSLKIIGSKCMNYTIKEMDAFNIQGISIPITNNFEKNCEIVPGFWNETNKKGITNDLGRFIKEEPLGILGFSICNDNQWEYGIGVASKEAEGYKNFEIPKATWAVFESEGKNTDIQQLIQQVLTEWLPNSGYEFGKAPDIEVYKNSDPENMRFEYWIPIVKII